MKRLMALFIAVFMLGCTACSNTDAQSADKLTNDNALTEADNSSEDELAGESFDELPDEAVDSLNYVSEKVEDIFPDAEGDRMYGYKGVQSIAETECYIFVIYTYADEVHTKVGTVAKAKDSETLYLLDDTTGEYKQVTLKDKEQSWAQTKTIAFIK